LIGWAGINSDPGAVQTLEAINNLRLMFAVIPAICVIFSLASVVFYPLTEKRMAEIEADLAAGKNRN
jgi:Na+/melibiose symporter-like transporter